jgi:predicted nucleic acid-binding protein
LFGKYYETHEYIGGEKGRVKESVSYSNNHALKVSAGVWTRDCSFSRDLLLDITKNHDMTVL